ncbi:hypothetical protein WMY93_017910 [Mugilogobius chulae]|uniref:AAA+ ATPase domain-containing protein n=1 Tax=Mugilogobius chulae TaxID=88201 RepID=A0AAW0NU67_9GOBI
MNILYKACVVRRYRVWPGPGAGPGGLWGSILPGLPWFYGSGEITYRLCVRERNVPEPQTHRFESAAAGELHEEQERAAWTLGFDTGCSRYAQHLASSSSQYVDLSDVAEELQRLYRQVQESTATGNWDIFHFPLVKMCWNATQTVYQSITQESDLNEMESKHLAKKAKQSQSDTGEGSNLSSDSDEEDESVLGNMPTNHMNSSLTSLYRKSSENAETPGSSSSPAPSSTNRSWFIDKNPNKDAPLIDLCDDEPAGTAQKVSGKSQKKSKKRTNAVNEAEESRPVNKKAKKSIELQYPTVTFEDVGGNEETLTDVCKLLLHMRHPEVYQQLGMVPPRGFLLHGPPGCGKTLLAQAVAGELGLPMLKVSAPELVSGVSGESEQKLRELFDTAVSSSPCILFIDEIDAITPKREVASKDMERRIVAQLLTCMDDLNSLTVTAQILVIGATNRPDSLDPALRRAGRFDREICLGIPDESARLRILKTLCRKLKLSEDIDYGQLARLTPGYVGADLMALCREAAMCAVNRALLDARSRTVQNTEESTTENIQKSPENPPESSGSTDVQSAPAQQGELWRLLQLLKNSELLSEEELSGLSILMSDFKSSLASVQPSAKREGFATVPDVTWDDIGALRDVRDELTMAILAPVRSPEQFKALGLSAPSGVLLAGPPGCGKTLLAKAVANESGLNFISVKGPELLNMYVGESERAVRQVFQRDATLLRVLSSSMRLMLCALDGRDTSPGRVFVWSISC